MNLLRIGAGMMILIGLGGTALAQSYDRSWADQLQHEHQGQRPQSAYRSLASSEIDVHFYRCQWQIDPAIKYIRGAVSIHFASLQTQRVIQFDLNPVLRVDSIFFRGRKQSFQQAAPQILQINLEADLAPGQRDSVVIFYQGVPAEGDFGSFVQMVKPNGVPAIWTLSQPYGSKDWWPCKNGQQDKADSIDIEITHPSQFSSTTNGVLWKKTQNGSLTTTYWRHRYPIASYLVAIAVSNYQSFQDSVKIGAGTLPLWLNAYQEVGTGLDFSMQIAKQAMQLFSQQMGDYPFWKEGYTQTQFNRGGGMEHQTNSFIERNNTDLVVHELLHQWFGDKVTCHSWEDVWLNEGFATYGHYLFMEQYDTARKIPHLDYLNELICSEPGGSLKVKDTTKAEEIFDFRLSYCKGSALLHMLRWTIGDTAFFQTLRQYHQDPALAFSTSRTRDFQRIAESVSGRSLQTFFRQWFEKEGYPNYQIQWWIDAQGRTVCKINQESSHPSNAFFEMPLPLHFSNGNQDTLLRVDHLFSGQQFVLEPGFIPTQLRWDPLRWLIAGQVSIEKINAPLNQPVEILLFPVPAPQQLNLIWKHPSGKQLQVSIYQSNGQLLYQQTRPNTGSDWVLRIPTQTWSSGIYWLKTSSDGTLQSVKKWSK